MRVFGELDVCTPKKEGWFYWQKKWSDVGVGLLHYNVFIQIKVWKIEPCSPGFGTNYLDIANERYLVSIVDHNNRRCHFFAQRQ